MNNQEIINKVLQYGETKSVIMRDFKTGKFILSIMKGFSGTDRKDFFCGYKTVLDITFNSRESAEKLQQQISKAQLAEKINFAYTH